MSVNYSALRDQATATPPHRESEHKGRNPPEVTCFSCFKVRCCDFLETPAGKAILAAVIILGVCAISMIVVFIPVMNRNASAIKASPTQGLTMVPPDNITTSSPTQGLTMVPPDNITTSSPTTNYTTKASGLTTAQPVLSYENKQSYAIPDQGSATSVINVTRTGDSGYVEITVDIKHESDVDLQITLYSPSEQAIVLRNDDPDGFARAHIHETYRIDMTGSESKGEWKLKVEDKFKEDHGTLKSWALNFQPPDSE